MNPYEVANVLIKRESLSIIQTDVLLLNFTLKNRW